jgi:hypothetical protein
MTYHRTLRALMGRGAPGSGISRKRSRTINAFNLFLGGFGQEVGGALLRMDPDAISSSAWLDTDISVGGAGGGVNSLLLTSNGNIPGILENLDRYSLTAGDPQFRRVTSFGGARGVGKRRPVSTILLAHQLTEVLPWLEGSLVRCLGRFSGPESPKLLVFNIIYSLCGGSGSALAIPCTMLARELVRRLDPTIELSVEAHVCTPDSFASKAVIPAERMQNDRNAAATIFEMKHCQVPVNQAGLAEALGIFARPIFPLFDRVWVYSLVDSSSCSQSDQQQWIRAACNLRASDNQALLASEWTHHKNTHTAIDSLGENAEAQAILGSSRSVIARLPIELLADAFAAQQLKNALTAATRPATDQRVQELSRGAIPILEVDQFLHGVDESLRPALAVPPASSLTEEELVSQVTAKNDWWTNEGRSVLQEKQRGLARSLPEEAQQKAEDCVKNLHESAQTASELTRSIRGVRASLEKRITSVRGEREKWARSEPVASHRRTLEALNRRRWRRRKAREEVRGSFLRLVQAEVKMATLATLQEQVLLPMLAVVRGALTDAERLEHGLDRKRSEFDRQARLLQGSIGTSNEDSTDIIAPREVVGMLDQVAGDLPSRMGPVPGLPLGSLLETQGDEEMIRQVLDGTAGTLKELFLQYVEDHGGDLVEMVGKFRLRFDPEQWIVEQVERLTLPARLSTSTLGGPGNYPIQLYVLVPERFLARAKEILAQAHPTAKHQVVPNDSPYELVLKMKVGGLTWEALASLPDLETAFRNAVSARGKTPEEVVADLSIHGSLHEAYTKPLVRTAPAADTSGNDTLIQNG